MHKDYLFENLFLGTGAMKAGTTWLYALLAHHPDLYFTPEKEIHYFAHQYTNESPLTVSNRLNRSKGYINSINPNLSNIDHVRRRILWTANYLAEPIDDLWFKNLFTLQRQQKYSVDFSNLNCHLNEQGWIRVKDLARNLKVLYIMRNPTERLWSHVKFHLQVSGQQKNLESWGAEEFREFGLREFMWKNARYGDIVKTLKANLTDDQLKVVFFDDIHRDQRKWLTDLEDFLGVRHINYPDSRLNARVNPSVNLPMPDFFPEIFEAEISEQLTKLEQQGMDIPDAWRTVSAPVTD